MKSQFVEFLNKIGCISKKCKTCDFETKSVYTMEVHVAKCKTENFECGWVKKFLWT